MKDNIASCTYLPIYGPNTRQWWVYNETKDVYIDPPAVILNLIKRIKPKLDGTRDIDGEEKFFDRILKNFPSWLGDTAHHYAEIEI